MFKNKKNKNKLIMENGEELDGGELLLITIDYLKNKFSKN